MFLKVKKLPENIYKKKKHNAQESFRYDMNACERKERRSSKHRSIGFGELDDEFSSEVKEWKWTIRITSNI